MPGQKSSCRKFHRIGTGNALAFTNGAVPGWSPNRKLSTTAVTSVNSLLSHVFANPRMKGRQPYWGQEIMRRVIRPTATQLGIAKHIGWHTFRHYAESGTMPHRVLSKLGSAFKTAANPVSRFHPCGIVRPTSQTLQETKQLIIGSVESSLALYGCSLRQHLLFQGEIGIEVDLSCLD